MKDHVDRFSIQTIADEDRMEILKLVGRIRSPWWFRDRVPRILNDNCLSEEDLVELHWCTNPVKCYNAKMRMVAILILRNAELPALGREKCRWAMESLVNENLGFRDDLMKNRFFRAIRSSIIKVIPFNIVAALVWGYLILQSNTTKDELLYLLIGIIAVGFVFSFLTGLLLAPFIMPWVIKYENRVRAAAARNLGVWLSVESLSILTRSCRMETSSVVVGECEYALKEILPLVGDDDRGRIRPAAVNDLCALLDRKTDLSACILGVLEHIGEAGAIPSVERAVKRGEPDAERILAVVQARVQREENRMKLLRPSEAPSSETLLRPAVNAGESDPSLLLRPSENKCDN